MEGINLKQLIDDHVWVRSGWKTVVDCKRQYQHAYELLGDDAHRDVHAFAIALIFVKEVLIQQIVDTFNYPRGEVDGHVANLLFEQCGSPFNPKGLNEWRADQ